MPLSCIWTNSATGSTLTRRPDPCRARLSAYRDIQRAAARRQGVSLNDLRSLRRRQDIVFARQMAMYLARQLTAHSLPAIGRCFGRDHTTVIHAVRRVQRLVDGRNNFVIEEIASLVAELQQNLVFGNPQISAADAALNEIGFELAIVKIGSRDENGFLLTNVQ